MEAIESDFEMRLESGTTDLWVIARDASGAPDIVHVRLDCTEQEMQEGEHYTKAIERAGELGYEPMAAFDERDPAGRKMLSLMAFEGWKQQESVPGDASSPVWSIPLTVDMTLSANVLAHGRDPQEARQTAAEFAASPQGFGLFSLDEGNYRGPSDFYCADPQDIECVPAGDSGNESAAQSQVHADRVNGRLAMSQGGAS
jgi:hypothetical protein